jgi:hypothetical protein
VRTSGQTLVIEDLQSRDGVRVNGVRIQGTTPLAHGDRIAICAYELVVMDAQRLQREHATTESHRAVGTPAEGLPPLREERTGEASITDVMLGGAEDALARGDAAGCAFGLGRLLETLIATERRGGEAPAIVRRYSVCALRAAGILGRREWIDAVVEIHGARPRVMHAATIDALEGALERIEGFDTTALRAYVARLEPTRGELAMYDRFCLERLRAMFG